MRCSSCGFPLSPSRTSCPRCGATISGDKADRRKSQVEAMPTPAQGGFSAPAGQVNDASTQQWAEQAPSPAWNAPGQMPFSQPTPLPGHQQDEDGNHEQLPFPEPDAVAANPQQPLHLSANPTPAPKLPQSWAPAAIMAPRTPATTPKVGAFAFPSLRAARNPRHTTRIGFTIAGLCVTVGFILLIVVYSMLQALPSGSQFTQGTTNETNAAEKIPTQVATAPAVSTPSETATETGTFPGAKHVDGVQLASEINTVNATATRPETNFKVKQRIYVTFSVHAESKGAVCLLWYLNDASFSSFNFDVNGVTPAYSWAVTSGTGEGYVEIYWATSTACADKILAQRADFTVSQ